MRELPLFLLLFLSSFLSAQCFITVSFLESECVDDGNSYILHFTVQGGGDSEWTSPTLGVGGAYNTDDVFSAGPFPEDAFETILFQDSETPACFNVYDPPLPDCPAPGCEDFVISATADPVTFCESGEVWSFTQTGGQLPVTVQILNEFGELVRQQILDSLNGVSTFIDEGAYSVIMTDESGCTASTVIEVTAHNCITITGFAWFDRNADGIQDAGERGASSILFELLDENGIVVDTMTSNINGNYFFGGHLPGTYSIRAVPYVGIGAVPCCRGDDCNNSDFDPITLTTSQFTLADGEHNTCIDAGWFATAGINGRSWRDDNGDGILTFNERERIAAEVILLLDGQEISSTMTDGNGSYNFRDLTPAAGYAVRFVPVENRDAVAMNAAGNLSCIDSDINPATFTTGEIEVFSSQFVSCVDAGWEALPCELFDPWISNESDQPPCSPESHVYIGLGNVDSLPVIVEFMDLPTEEITRLDTINSPNGAEYFDLPSGVYRITLTGPEGCTVTDTIEALRGEGCGYFGGTSWRDDNENGIRDEYEPLFTTVELLQGGTVIEQRSSSWSGYFGFEHLPVGDYQLRFTSPPGFEPTIKGATGDGNDSDVNPASNLTDILTVPPGGRSDTINVGWVQTFACSEFQLNIGIEPDNLECTSLGEYVASVPVASYPLDFFLINPFTRDTLETVTLTEEGDARFFITVQANYIIAAHDASGCSDEYNFSARSNEPLSVWISQSGTSCLGDSVPTLTAEVSPIGQNLSYLWSNGETGQSITNVNIGDTYGVTVTNEFTNCTRVAFRTVTSVIPDYLATITFSPPYTLGCGQDSVLIEPDTTLAGYDYLWYDRFNNVSEGPALYASEAGLYRLEATHENGCSISGRVFVESSSLDDHFIELFKWSEDTACTGIICFGLETSVNFGEDSPFSVTWQGPDQQFNDFANSVGSNNFCGVDPGLYQVTITSECDTVVRSLFIDPLPECNSISGTLWVDQAADCDLDPEDTPVPRYIVTLTNQSTGDIFYTMTGPTGNWTATVPVGVYLVEPTLDPLSPFGACPPPVITLSDFPITGVQLFLSAENACPQLTTTITMPFLRRCFSGQAYVQYENRGSATATDAELVVVLDDFFDNVVPDRPFASRVGNTFTFELGDVDPFDVETIRFNFVVSCQASLGQSHCMEASIKPDAPCVNNENWGGALVQVDAVGCDGDSVRFDISNIGVDQMSIPLTYIIIEDGIMLSPDPFTNGLLLPNETMPVVLPSNGSTYQVVTNQEPNAPGFDDPTAVVEGCNTGGETFSTGFTNILPLNDGVLTTTTICRENVGAYDPNDKTGYPLGFGGDNGILAGTRLDYAIRFQNTGTDTAFTVVIRDTLPGELDLATLKLDAASHDFEASLDSNRVLTFVFENILLPDSTTNLAESQGVVQFSIDHDPTLSPGSVIRNEAAIYFDFNEPIITNKTRHVITKDGLPVGTRAELARQVALTVYPNPTTGVLNVRIPLADVSPADELQVTDLYGRTLAATTYAQALAGWNLSHLPAGYYLVVVTDAAGRPRGRTGFVVAK